MKTKALSFSENSELLFRDIKDLHAQYLREVPSSRRQWPVSIRRRVEELWSQGISSHTIAAKTDLPAQTLYAWRSIAKKSEKGFVAIDITQEKSKSLPLPPSPLDEVRSRSIPTTVTVVLPNGIRLEGMNEDAVLRFARESLR